MAKVIIHQRVRGFGSEKSHGPTNSGELREMDPTVSATLANTTPPQSGGIFRSDKLFWVFNRFCTFNNLIQEKYRAGMVD